MTEQQKQEPKKTKALDIYKGNLEQFKPFFEQALPTTARKYLTPDRIVRVVLNAMWRLPELQVCTIPSVLMAVMDCVQVGLEPGGPLGHAWLIPFKDKKKGVTIATPIIGYKGYITLGMRGGMMAAPPYAQLVGEHDEFDLDLGKGEPPTHRFDPRAPMSDRGAVIGAYCVAKFKDGGCHVEWMAISEIEAIKSRSRAAQSSFSPWQSDPDMMQRKTVIRRAKNFWPLSSEMAQAFEVDDRSDTGDKIDPSLVYEQSFADAIAELPQTLDEVAEYQQGSRTDQIAADLARQKRVDEEG